ncbi:glutamate racemase [Patescibacteria group bacterium]
MNNSPVLIIDSGSGGITIWKAFVNLLANESTIYIGDHANTPYGSKSKNFIQNRVIKIINSQKQNNIKLIIIACNTATVAGIDVYRKKFPDVPIIGVVPVIKTAASITMSGNIAILSTDFIKKSKYQLDLIKLHAKKSKVFSIGVTSLVSLIEEGKLNQITANRKLKSASEKINKNHIDTVVLGCTHFPLVKDIIQKALGHKIILLDSGGAVTRHAKSVLTKNNKLAQIYNPSYTFITTGNSKIVSGNISNLINEKIVFKSKNI